MSIKESIEFVCAVAEAAHDKGGILKLEQSYQLAVCINELKKHALDLEQKAVSNPEKVEVVNEKVTNKKQKNE